MIIFLSLLSLARLVTSDLEALLMFAEGGPAPPLNSKTSSPSNILSKSPVPQFNPVPSKLDVVSVEVSHHFYVQPSSPMFFSGVPFGARQVGGQKKHPPTVKSVTPPNHASLPASTSTPQFISETFKILTSSTPPAAPVFRTVPVPPNASLVNRLPASLEIQRGLMRLSKTSDTRPVVETIKTTPDASLLGLVRFPKTSVPRSEVETIQTHPDSSLSSLVRFPKTRLDSLEVDTSQTPSNTIAQQFSPQTVQDVQPVIKNPAYHLGPWEVARRQQEELRAAERLLRSRRSLF